MSKKPKIITNPNEPKETKEKQNVFDDLFGQDFEPSEVTDAMDFRDIANHYNLLELDEEFLLSFLDEDLRVGQRLYLAMYLPAEKLGTMLLKETDKRLIHICKERCGENNRGGKIILSGE